MQPQAEKEGFQFLLLLLCLLASILVPGYFEHYTWFVVIWKGVFTLMLLSAAYSVIDQPRLWIPIAILLVPTVVTVWGQFINEHSRWLFYLDNLTTIAFLGFVCVQFLKYILTRRRVTNNVIYASMCVYLMAALIWAAIFANIHVFYEGAFHFATLSEGQHIPNDQLMGVFSYYSFVTLSTVGYGDIVPVHKVAQSWAALEAMMGQFYIAIIVARLVSMHTAQPAER